MLLYRACRVESSSFSARGSTEVQDFVGVLRNLHNFVHLTSLKPVITDCNISGKTFDQLKLIRYINVTFQRRFFWAAILVRLRSHVKISLYTHVVFRSCLSGNQTSKCKRNRDFRLRVFKNSCIHLCACWMYHCE